MCMRLSERAVTICVDMHAWMYKPTCVSIRICAHHTTTPSGPKNTTLTHLHTHHQKAALESLRECAAAFRAEQRQGEGQGEAVKKAVKRASLRMR